MGKVRVVIVDDSALMRVIIKEILESVPDLEVVGEAEDPYVARDLIKSLKPDVITLDVEMPRMDGISFLKNLMRLHPMPVVMISTLTQKGADTTLEALELGAVDYISKPSDRSVDLLALSSQIIEKVRAAAGANVRALEGRPTAAPRRGREYDPLPGHILVIGASTGGTEAIKEVLVTMPANSAPILIAQHIPPVFSTTYAARLDRQCVINVYEARHGMKVEQGCAYLAPGDFHMTLKRVGKELYCQLNQEERVNRHRPSVEVLFDSVREVVGTNATGALLTGMGEDGSAALLRLKEAGAWTIVQDRETSVVWGMPGVAARLGAACEELPLGKISHSLMERSNRLSGKKVGVS